VGAVISVLRDQSNNYVGEDIEGITITSFDGTTITATAVFWLRQIERLAQDLVP
jgi:hypothetical protein